MAIPTDGYNAASLTASVRATDGVDDETLAFTMADLTPSAEAAATAALNAMADALLQQRGEGWQVTYKVIRYTGVQETDVA